MKYIVIPFQKLILSAFLLSLSLSAGVELRAQKPNWIEQEINRFRSYPHLRRAYSLIEAGDLESAKSELQEYLRMSPEDPQARAALVIVCYQLRQFEEAASQAEEVLQRDPTLHSMKVYCGLAYQALGEAVNALRCLETLEIRSLAPQDRRLPALTKSDLLISLGRYAEALETLDPYLIEGPGLYFRRGLALERLARLDEAKRAYQQALGESQMGRERKQAYLALADIHRRQEEWSEARSQLLSALMAQPQDPEVLRRLSELHRSQGNIPEALSWARQALRIDPEDTRLRETVAHFLVESGNPSDAVAEFRSLLSRLSDAQDLRRIHMALGYVLYGLGRFEQAQDQFLAAHTISADSESIMAAGNALEKAGQFSRASQLLEEYFQRHSTPEVGFRLGNLLLKRGEKTKAGSVFQQIADRLPPSQAASVNRQLGYLFWQENQLDQAIISFRRALTLDPSDDSTSQALLGVLKEQGDDESLVRAYERRLKTHPEDVHLHLELARLFKEREPEAAIEQLRRFIQTTDRPELKAQALAELGFLHSSRNQIEEAEAAFQASLQAHEPSAPVYQALAQAQLRLGKQSAAEQSLERSVELEESKSVLFELGSLYLSQEKMDKAYPIFQRLGVLDLDDSERTRVARVLGNIEFWRNDFQKAAVSYQRAHQASGQDSYLRQAVEAAIRSQDWDLAAKILEQLVAGAQGREKGELARRLGLVELWAERYERALRAFQIPEAAGTADSETYHHIGYALYQMEEFERAARAFHRAVEEDPERPDSLLHLARSHLKLGEPDLAIQYFEQALPYLEISAQKEVLDQLGYLYFEESDFAGALSRWSQSLELQEDPGILLAAASAQRFLGDEEAAFRRLNEIDPEHLSPAQQALRLEELSLIHLSRDEASQAVTRLERALQIEETPLRFFLLGTARAREGKLAEAESALLKARRIDPDDPEVAGALGYLYERQGKLDEAAGLLEEYASARPGRGHVYEDLGYLYMKQVKNERAAYWFRRAIDQLNTKHPSQYARQGESLDERRHRLRKEVATLSNVFDVAGYFSYRTTPTQEIAGLGAGGAIPSQGGLEIGYRLPGIGFRNQRIFQAYGRFLWNSEPGSLDLDSDSYQAALGFRYKPLVRQNLFVGAEKLFAVGDNALSNWLLRGLYSWSDGNRLNPGRQAWNHTSFFGEAAGFVGDPEAFVTFAEVRQGITLNTKDRVLWTPHAILASRLVEPEGLDGSYLEGGAGLAIKFLMSEGEYVAHRGAFELWVHYKVGRFFRQPSGGGRDDVFRGWVFTTLFSF